MYRIMKVLLFSFAMFGIVHAGMNLRAEDDQERTGVTKYGVTHNVASDREIVSIGGRYEPEGIDFYLKKKFDALDLRVTQVVDKIDELEKKLSQTDEKIELLLNKSPGNSQ